MLALCSTRILGRRYIHLSRSFGKCVKIPSSTWKYEKNTGVYHAFGKVGILCTFNEYTLLSTNYLSSLQFYA